MVLAVGLLCGTVVAPVGWLLNRLVPNDGVVPVLLANNEAPSPVGFGATPEFWVDEAFKAPKGDVVGGEPNMDARNGFAPVA